MKEWWHKITGKPSFRTVYDEGGQTYRMDHWQADQLAQIFGGTVVFDPVPNKPAKAPK